MKLYSFLVAAQVARFATKAATTFAPRASGASKNPAYKGICSPLCYFCHLCSNSMLIMCTNAVSSVPDMHVFEGSNAMWFPACRQFIVHHF